ncbi:hypothetical protein TrST_g3971 [Triparma strigata]|uniref:C2H2-type domain-containing protein n=1 Tax=Triparma strigata TaxID=1606541 RepID=A0A9W6ZT28_9STRA|nr:hypothetical protein TrST_g3971 [Triparma strigata]
MALSLLLDAAANASQADMSPHENEIQFMAPYSFQPSNGPIPHPLFSAVSAIENNGGVVTQAGLGKGGLVPTGPEAPRKIGNWIEGVERNKHGKIVRTCGINGCTFKAAYTTQMRNHKASKHNIDVRWFRCQEAGCDYKAKYAGHVKRHKQSAHNINVVWHHCKEDDCAYKAKDAGNLKKHKQLVHDINVRWYYCGEPGTKKGTICDFKSKQAGHIKRHKQYVHDIDVQWHYCLVDGCEYKAKLPRNLKRHKQDRHNIDVKWRFCDVKGCEYKAKQPGNLKQHRQRIHNITTPSKPAAALKSEGGNEGLEDSDDDDELGEEEEDFYGLNEERCIVVEDYTGTAVEAEAEM